MVAKNNEHETKRKRARFTLSYSVINKPNIHESTQTTDVSITGIAFGSTLLHQIGTLLECTLKLPSVRNPIQFVGRVAHIGETEKGTKYSYSITFNSISDKDKHFLDSFVQITDIDTLLNIAVLHNASDLHLVADKQPYYRVEGKLIPIDSMPVLASEELEQMILSILTEHQRILFNKNLELDCSYFLPSGMRFRVNVHLDKGNLEAAFRVIPAKIRSLDELGLPKTAHNLARAQRGLIIVSGATGSGKSTTLASMIDIINSERNCMVVCIEDPIEYVHTLKKSIIKQREIGADSHSFANALKHVLRQDPDVILVGEIRDLESISVAISAAETGHLVLTTLHTTDTAECINRILDVYPAEQQRQVRVQLAACLQGIIGQILLPVKDGSKRVLASEVLISTPAIQNLIREGKISQISTYIKSGKAHGMQLMDDSLKKLVDEDIIETELAKGFAKDPSKF